MRRILYFVLSILSLVYIGAICLFTINGYMNFLDPNFAKTLGFLVTYGGVALLAAFAFVNFFGRSLKIVFFLLLLLVLIFYIILNVAPELFTNIVTAPQG